MRPQLSFYPNRVSCLEAYAGQKAPLKGVIGRLCLTVVLVRSTLLAGKSLPKMVTQILVATSKPVDQDIFLIRRSERFSR